MLLIEGAPFEIALGKLQPFEGHVVEIRREWLLFQAKLGLIGGLAEISRERALIEALLQHKGRLVSEQHLEMRRTRLRRRSA